MVLRRWLPLIAALSGMCGIAYEVMYARFLTTWVGDMVHVSAAVLAAFLLGIAAGSLLSSRFVERLWLVEVLIGVWALGFGLAFEPLFEAAASRGLVSFLTTPLGVVAFVLVVLSPPAVLIGFSVPLFAQWIESGGRSRDDAFGTVYRGYNLGAALCVLLLEVVLLRALGQRGALYFLGGTNLLIGALLVFASPPAPRERESLLPDVRAHRRPLQALFLVSVMSGVFQMFFLKLATHLFGPYRESFAFVVALGLAGISLGTFVVRRTALSFPRLLVVATVVVGGSLLATGPLVYLWAFLAPLAEGNVHAFRALKLVVLALLGGGSFAALGATVPALLAGLPEDRRLGGLLLAVSAAGNCVGYLSAVLALYTWLEPARIAALLAAAPALIALLLLEGTRRRLALVGVALSAALLVSSAWPGRTLSLGYLSLRSLSALTASQHETASVREVRRAGSDVHLVRAHSGVETLIIDGYHSLVVNQQNKTNPRELLYGIVPALYPKERTSALVLGAGTGITAGAVAGVFDDVTVVDVNPAIVALLPVFSRHNLDLVMRDDARVLLEDGITVLWREERTYDAIVNTVTTPLFFSSSKLYTLDFFELVKRRLNDDGVYAMWFDARVGERGARIIFETLRAAFEDCHLVVMAAGYAQVVCGKAPLRPRMLEERDLDPALLALLREKDEHFALPRLLDAMVLPAHGILTREWDAPRNTFDRPALELAMGDQPVLKGFSPFELAGADVRRSAFSKEPLVGQALLDRCAHLMRVSSLLPGCVRAATQDFGRSARARFSDAVRRAGVPLHPLAVADLARISLSAGDFEVAGALLEQTFVDGSVHPRWLQVKAEHQLASTGTVDDDLLARLLVRAPLDPEARRLFALALEMRGQGPLARQQLDVLLPGEGDGLPTIAPSPFDTPATRGPP